MQSRTQIAEYKLYNRTDFPTTNVLNLKGTVRADDLDTSLAKFYEDEKVNKKFLLIDLKKAEFLEITFLVDCIAFLLARVENSCETFLGYPDRQSVRDFLFLWRFQEAIEDATKRSFRSFLVEEDHIYLSEKQKTYTGIGTGLDALK